jgi:hypothetical protein
MPVHRSHLIAPVGHGAAQDYDSLGPTGAHRAATPGMLVRNRSTPAMAESITSVTSMTTPRRCVPCWIRCAARWCSAITPTAGGDYAGRGGTPPHAEADSPAFPFESIELIDLPTGRCLLGDRCAGAARSEQGRRNLLMDLGDRDTTISFLLRGLPAPCQCSAHHVNGPTGDMRRHR